MDKLWQEWGAPLLYIVLNIACVLVLLRLCAWLVAVGLRRWSGVDISCKGVWLRSIREIRIKWRRGEVGVCGLRVGLRCFSRSARRLIKVDVDQVYCVKFPEADLSPTPGGRGSGSGERMSSVRGVATAVLLWLSKRLSACTDVAVGSVLLDMPCPWGAVSTCAVGVSLKGCTLVGARLPRGEGLSVAAQVDQGVVRVASEDSEPTAASRDLFSAVFAGQLVLHLDLGAARPIRLLQLGVVPAGACLFADSLKVMRESRGGGAPPPSRGYSHMIGMLAPLLPLKTEAMLEEGTLEYLGPDNRKLAVKLSRFLFSATPCSSCDGVAMETHIHNLRLCTSSSVPVSSINLLHHSAELTAEQVTQYCSITSLRGTVKDGGVVHWVRHFAALLPGPVPVGQPPPQVARRQSSHQDTSVNKTESVAMAITLEANDCQLECHLEQQQPSSPAVCHLLVASVVGSVQSEWHSNRRMLRHSVRMGDVCLSVPGCAGQRGREQQGTHLSSVLPSSFRHVWGRMVAMGTCFVEVITKYPGGTDGDVRGCPPAPLAVECSVDCGIVEWSHDTAEFVSAVVSNLRGHYGVTASQKGGWSSGWSLPDAAKRGSFQLRVSNLNCIATEQFGEAHTVLLVHADVFRAANQPGGREVVGGMWWECEALHSGQVGVSGLAVCAEAFEGQGKVFPCLLMSDLPLGVLEVPQFSVEVQRRDRIDVVAHISECAVNWSPTQHCTAKHVLDAVVDSVQVVLSKSQEAAPLDHISQAPSFNCPSPFPLSQYLSKLSDVCVSVDVTKASVNITVNTAHRVSCVVAGGVLSASHRQCALSAKQVEAVFDKNRIVLVSDLAGQLLDEDDPLTWSRSDFPQLSLPRNTSFELVACRVEVTFPHEYYFAETFEKLQAARKFLSHVHAGGGEAAALGLLVPPDLYLRADSFSFQLQDSMFEANLKSNHMLLTDVQSQRMEFVKALESKISQIEQEQGKISAKKKQALYESLEAQVYCDKAKAYYSDEPPSRKLFEVFLQHPRLVVLSDPSMLGTGSLVQQLQDIDRSAALPANTAFSTLWGCYMTGEASQFQLLFRDYPQPLLSQSDVSMRGRSILAEEEAIKRATQNIAIRLDPPWANVTVVKRLAALKLYHDWDWKCKVSIGCWGSCYEPVLAQVNLSLEKVVKRSIDPSKPLPFWDKMRVIFHGPFKMAAEHAQLLLLSTRDPYNLTEYLDCQSTHFSLRYDTGVLELSGALDVFIHTASKYDESQLLHVPRAVFRANLKWLCPADPNAHHGVMPCAPDKAPPLEDSQVHDSFAGFRSQCLNLRLSLDVQPGGEEDTRPTLVLYASTLRWLQQFQSVLFRVTSLPVRRGTVHGNVRPKQLRFSRHLRDVDITATCASGEVCYWGSASQQSGVHGNFKVAEASFSYSLALVPFDDGLVRRPQADWHITTCQGAGEGIEVVLHHLAEGRRGKGTEFLHHLRLDDAAKQHLLSMGRVQYTRLNEQQNLLGPELQLPLEYRHQLQTLDTRVSWTSLSRTILSGLFDAHRQSQAVKNNLLSDALKPAKHVDLRSKNVVGVSDSSPPRTLGGESPGGKHSDGHDHRHRSPGSANLLTQLISDVTRRVVEHTDESGRSTEPRLRGKEACSQDDIEQQNWLIQLENTQLAFQGVESHGCVLVSSTLTHATNHTHSPRLGNGGDILVKTSWEARVEDMQYFATIDPEVCVSTNNMPWISTSRVMGQPLKVAVASDHIQRQEAYDINALLLGTLGPQDSSTNVRDPLIGGVSSGVGEGVGGLVTSTAHLGNGEPIQLQRIASRCYCQIFYVTYSQDGENSGHLTPKVSPVKDDQPCVDTFTIRHPSVHISTTSSQYAMLLDIVNNLLLYKEPRQKELTETMKRLRFTLQLSNIEDCRTPILARQERVRQLMGSIRTVEKEISLASKSTDSPSEAVEDLHDRLSELKAQLHQVGQELDVLIKLFKENQFFLPASVAPSQSKKPHPVRCIEVWLDDARWRLTESDGQIELADVTLANCCYVRNTFSDDSGEHRFELQDCSVQNLSPTAAYQDVLVAYDRDWRVDKNVRLRVYCRDKAPVAGISVKDHFEVNVVPLKVQLTQQFYGRMFEFFFPSRTVHEEGPQDSEMAHLIVGTQPHLSGDGQPEGVGEGGGDRSRRKKSALDSQRRKGATMELSDVERMRERALQIKTFLYIKITPVPLLISYHGKQGGIPIDIDNFKVSTPTLEYHNRNWTWKDLFMAIKRDCKQAIVPKAIKTKLGMEPRSEHRQGLVLGREATGPLDMQLLWSGGQRASKRLKSKGSKEPELK